MRSGYVKFAAILGVLVMIGGAVCIQVAVWNECRAHDSFFYCLALTSSH